MSATPSDNPFASPQADPSDDVATADEVWRDGELLVARVGAELPHRCLKCGKPGVVRRRMALWPEVPDIHQNFRKLPIWMKWAYGWSIVGLLCISLSIFLYHDQLTNWGPEWMEDVAPKAFTIVLLASIWVTQVVGWRVQLKNSPLHISLCGPHNRRLLINGRIESVWYLPVVLVLGVDLIEHWLDINVSMSSLLMPLLMAMSLLYGVRLLIAESVECKIVEELPEGRKKIRGAGEPFLDSLPAWPPPAGQSQDAAT